MWLSKCLLWLTWVLEGEHSCGDLNLSCSGEERKDWKPRGLSEQWWPQLSGQSGLLKTSVEKFYGLRAEWSVLVCVQCICSVVLDGRGVVVGYGKARGWKYKGSDKCLHLSELTVNHSNHRYQVSWRTGSWVKERLLSGYFWLWLWMLLTTECLRMYHNHGDHMFPG